MSAQQKVWQGCKTCQQVKNATDGPGQVCSLQPAGEADKMSRRREAAAKGSCPDYKPDPRKTEAARSLNAIALSVSSGELEAAKKVAAAATAPDEAGAAKKKTSYTAAELLAMEIDELPCLYAPIFLKQGIAVVAGGQDAGKSTLLRQLCMCVAAGQEFMGWPFSGKHKRAIYFSSEDDAVLTSRSLRSLNQTIRLDSEAAARLRFEYDLNPETITERLKSMLEEQPADLVIIDALGDAFNGRNLNDSKEVRTFYAPFKDIAERHECLIIFNHHTGKRTTIYAPDKDNTLGSQAVTAAPRMAIEIRHDPHDPEVRHLCIVKANYLPTDYKTSSYEMKQNNSWVFYRTGQRVPFDDLAKPATPDRRSKTPGDYPDEYHKERLRAIFADEAINQQDLFSKIAVTFSVSTSQAKKLFEPYYKEKRWIGISEKRGPHNQAFYVSLVN